MPRRVINWEAGRSTAACTTGADVACQVKVAKTSSTCGLCP
ncbi:MAG TPA: hypothetical protein VNJ70_13895 [Thermoanaerobaculia bacterium]|nr:hypothetical protein [Thermoanaerobaculia bacterium]